MNYNDVRKVRKELGMTLSELARRSRASRETITNIELHNQVPNGLLMLRIADALKVDAKDIFFEYSANHELQRRVK